MFGSMMEAAQNNDSLFPFVTLLMHMNGANGGTTFTDQKGATVTVIGNAQTSTANYKWNGSSYLGDGTTDGLKLPLNSGYDFGNGDFTIDYWFYTGSATFKVLYTYAKITILTGNDIAFVAEINNPGIYFYFFSGTTQYVIASATPPSTSTWHFFRVIRSGSDLRAALDGIEINTATNIGSASINAPVSRILSLNISTDSVTRSLAGNTQDFRITKGVARNLTEVPINPFPNFG